MHAKVYSIESIYHKRCQRTNTENWIVCTMSVRVFILTICVVKQKCFYKVDWIDQGKH